MIFETAKRIVDAAMNGVNTEATLLQEESLVEAVIDAAWLYDLTLDPTTPAYTNLSAFISTHSATNPYFHTTALKRLDGRLLESSRLIDSSAILNKRQVRANTAMFYKQAKYNAHVEESEGWARVLETVASSVAEGESMASEVLQLVGGFSLDPNRVVDCVVDGMVCAVNLKGPCKPLLSLLKCLSLPAARVMEIVALKLFSDNPSLWIVIAMMIEEEIVKFEDVLGYLDKDRYTPEESFSTAVKRLAITSDPFGFHDIASAILQAMKPSVDRRVLLFTAFLETRQLPKAATLLNTFGDLHVDHPPSWHLVGDLLLQLPPSHPEFAFWLHKFSRFMFVNVAVCVKLAQVLSMEHLVELVFPLLPFLPPLPVLHHIIHDRLSGIPFDQRFKILQRLAIDGSAGVGRVHAQDVKRVMRRVSKENVKQCGRLLGKLVSMAPMLVCSIVIDQIKAYDNMIVPLVDTLRFASPLAIDCLLSSLLYQLTTVGKSRVKEDGVHVAGWLQRVALFMAHLSKKYVTVDLTAVISFLTDRLNTGHSDELPCLTELFKHVGGVEVTMGTVNERALEVSFGGPQLREAALFMSAGQDTLIESRHRLIAALKQQPDCRLWRLLAKQPLIQVSREYDSEEVKAQSHAFDTAFEAFFMYTSFVEACGEASLVCGLPGIESLRGEGIDGHLTALMLRVKQRVLGEKPSNTDFMQMSITDIYTPTGRYEQEIARLKSIACSPQAKPQEKERALGFVLHLERECNESVKRTAMVSVEPSSTDSIIARSIMTPTEAVFCAEYLRKLDDHNITNEIIQKLPDLLFAFSEREATCFGRFLSLALHQNLSPAQHVQLFAAFNAALSSPSFIPIRNGILCLTKLDSVFPRHRQIAVALEQRCRLLHDTDGREDVRVLSTRCRALMATIAQRLPGDVITVDDEVSGLADTFAEINSLASSVASSPAPPIASSVELEEGEHPVVAEDGKAEEAGEVPKLKESPSRKRKIEDIINEEDLDMARKRHNDRPDRTDRTDRSDRNDRTDRNDRNDRDSRDRRDRDRSDRDRRDRDRTDSDRDRERKRDSDRDRHRSRSDRRYR